MAIIRDHPSLLRPIPSRPYCLRRLTSMSLVAAALSALFLISLAFSRPPAWLPFLVVLLPPALVLVAWCAFYWHFDSRIQICDIPLARFQRVAVALGEAWTRDVAARGWITRAEWRAAQDLARLLQSAGR